MHACLPHNLWTTAAISAWWDSVGVAALWTISLAHNLKLVPWIICCHSETAFPSSQLMVPFEVIKSQSCSIRKTSFHPVLSKSQRQKCTNTCTFTAVCSCDRRWGWEKGYCVPSTVALMFGNNRERVFVPDCVAAAASYCAFFFFWLTETNEYHVHL